MLKSSHLQTALTKHENNFNFLRLIGALFVVISHSFDVVGRSEAEPLSTLTKGVLGLSGVGLTLFFFISGYFVTASAFNSTSLNKFIQKRIFRIYPALNVLVIISVFVAGPILSTLSIHQYFCDKDSWLYLFTATGLRVRMNLPGVFTLPEFYINAFNASLWTIGLEIQLYMSLTLMLLLGRKSNKKLFTITSLLITIVCFCTVSFHQSLSFSATRQLNLIGIFYFGGFIYLAEFSRQNNLRILLCSSLLFVMFAILKIPGFNPIALCIVGICMIVYYIGYSKKIRINIQTDISYGLYIYAFPIQQTFFMIAGNHNPWINLAGGLLFTLPFALASWFWIEKRFILLKYKVSK